MNRIDKKFRELRKKRQKAFIVYITAGDPSLDMTAKIAAELAKNGADIIELGIPFSDPLADGPTIQAASQRALSGGVDVKSVLKLTACLRKRLEVPIVFMTYYNLVYHYGLRRFAADAKKSGADGIIIPDLPIEESRELTCYAGRKDFHVIFLAAPTSTPDRLKRIASRSKGFIYYVSLTGVTGARKKMAKDIFDSVRKIKALTRKPVCVGFGVSKPAQAKRIASFADGVIVGSAIIKIVEKNIGRKNLVYKVGAFARQVARAVKG